MSSRPPVILVVGATGNQGGAAIKNLLEERDTAKTLRFITRRPQSSGAVNLLKQGANVYEADAFDKKALKIALEGVNCAYLVTNPNGEEETIQGKVFISLCKDAGVKHIVFSSVCGADQATKVPHFQTKLKIEEYLKASGIQYTILRPVAFMDNFPVERSFMRFLLIGSFFAMTIWKPVQFVSCDDIGVVAAKALLNPSSEDFRNKTIDLSAGEYDLNSVLDAYEKVQGVRPWVASWFPSFLVNIIPFDAKQMMLYFRNPGYPKVDMDKVKNILPNVTSFQDYVARNRNKIKTD